MAGSVPNNLNKQEIERDAPKKSVIAKSSYAPAQAEMYDITGRIFREIWAVNGPFSDPWMADFNREVWAAGAEGTLGGAEEAKRGTPDA
jgi:hypothetical protein